MLSHSDLILPLKHSMSHIKYEADEQKINKSFEINQSFPKSYPAKTCASRKTGLHQEDSYLKRTKVKNVNMLSRNENSFSFSSFASRGSFSKSILLNSDQISTRGNSSSMSWRGGYRNGIYEPVFTNTVVNPNKAILCLDMHGNILTCNDMAAQLLEYPLHQLTGLNFYKDILKHRNETIDSKCQSCPEAIGEVELCLELENESGGVLVSGQVVDIETKGGSRTAFSLWLKNISSESNDDKNSPGKSKGRRLAILEPVERTVGKIEISGEGKIIQMDKNSELIFQCDGILPTNSMNALSITKLIPNFEVDKLQNLKNEEKWKMKLTGQTTDNIAFPLAACTEHVKFAGASEDSVPPIKSFIVTISVFSNISGLMLTSEDGIIQTCNPNFIHLLLGYKAHEIIGKNIEVLIPGFYKDIELMEPSMSQESQGSINECCITESIEKLNLREDKDQSKQALISVSESKIPFVEEKYDDSGIASKKISAKTRLVFPHLEDCGDQTAINGRDMKNYKQQELRCKEKECVDMDKDVEDTGIVDGEANKENMSLNKDISVAYKRNTVQHSKPITSTPSERSYRNKQKNQNLPEEENELISLKLDCITNRKMEDEVFDENEFVRLDRTVPFEFPQGSFFGFGKHVDGSEINILYQICKLDFTDRSSSGESRRISTCNSEQLYALWISRDPEEQRKGRIGFGSSTLTSTIFDVSSPSMSHTSVLTNHEKSFGQNIIEASKITMAQNKNISLDRSADLLRNDEKVNDSYSSPSKQDKNEHGGFQTNKAREPHQIATYWQEQIERAKLLDTSNIHCQMEGSYEQAYHTLEQIGKGAFGCVKEAIRIIDHKMVVTKFIKKNKIHSGQWKGDSASVDVCSARNPTVNIQEQCSAAKKHLPEEIAILLKLDHPNIIKVLDVHANEHYFQMVMEHHGQMDLFEFIERRHSHGHPNLGYQEPVESYIFGQIVSAVEYLHNVMHIIHRDIKDENVIIDERFQVKLIDFGSATYYVPLSAMSTDNVQTQFFSTFYGTVEYCAPEVLAGEKYHGPELEMWSLGVLLYILLFGEQPFTDIEETLRCDVVGLKPPFNVSSICFQVVCGLLVKDPGQRMTMNHFVKSGPNKVSL